MITTYNFGEIGKKSDNSIFHTSSKPDYSKIIDDVITADIIAKNSYLFSKTNDYLDDLLINAKPTKDTKLEDAINLLANYNKLKSKKSYFLPFKLNTLYTLSDGTPIIFFDDEIQIGCDFYKYTNFSNASFINTLTPKKKKVIIDIFASAGTDIDINIL